MDEKRIKNKKYKGKDSYKVEKEPKSKPKSKDVRAHSHASMVKSMYGLKG